MRTFRALVVDDEPAVRTLAVRAGRPEDGIIIDTAADLTSARVLIAQHHYQAAVVDMQLRKGADQNVDGLTLLGELKTLRPNCRRLLLTMYPEKYRRELFSLLDPDATVIDGAIDKSDFEHLFTESIIAAAKRWLAGPVDVVGLERIFDLLGERRVAGKSMPSGLTAQVTPGELDAVISRLFGQGGDSPLDSDSFTKIELTPLTGGRSRSVVAVGQPTSANGARGLPCVVKVGPREDTAEEIRRYDRYVRFRVGLHRRVEILATSLADTLGAVCYTRAAEHTDLQSLLDREDPAAMDVFGELMGTDDEWHGDQDQQPDLARFFQSSYGLEPLRISRAVESWAKANAEKLGFRLAGDKLLVPDGQPLRLPTVDLLSSGRLRNDYIACISHGDMNASNVIVAGTGKLTLIDFRHTARGPAAIDFAALQASIRLTPQSLKAATDMPGELERLERRLWRSEAIGRFETTWDARAGTMPYWAQASDRLNALAQARLSNIPAADRIATHLLYALRVFRVSLLPVAARLRLLIWMSALITSLEREG